MLARDSCWYRSCLYKGFCWLGYTGWGHCEDLTHSCYFRTAHQAWDLINLLRHVYRYLICIFLLHIFIYTYAFISIIALGDCIKKKDAKYCRDKNRWKNCRYGVGKHQPLLSPGSQTCHKYKRKKSHSLADKKENLTVTPQVEKLRTIFLLGICKQMLGWQISHYKSILNPLLYLIHTRYLTNTESLPDMNSHQQVLLLSHLQRLLLSISFTFRGCGTKVCNKIPSIMRKHFF